jgi:hypothetical protein
LSKRQIENRTLIVYNMSVTKALKKCALKSKPAILAELQQMLDKDVWEKIDKANFYKRQLRAMIRSSMFLKENFKANGKFKKMKARLIAGGDGHDKELYENLSSPTVTNESVFMLLALAAILKQNMATVDITRLYLECFLPEGDEVIIKLDKTHTELLPQLDPIVKHFVGKNGKLAVKLKKALYGCVQSSKLWYEKLRDVLLEAGFVVNDHDPCERPSANCSISCRRLAYY